MLAKQCQDEDKQHLTHIDTAAVKELAESATDQPGLIYDSLNLTGSRTARASSLHARFLALWGSSEQRLPLHDTAPTTTAALRSQEEQHKHQVRRSSRPARSDSIPGI